MSAVSEVGLVNAISPINTSLPSPESTAVGTQTVSIPPIGRSQVYNVIAGWLLQASHRIGAVALLATLGTWFQMYRMGDFHWPLAAAAAAGDLGFCLALLGRIFVRHNSRLYREANGVAIFNLVLFILAIYFIAFARLPVIRADAAAFFTPTELRPGELR